jgi:hypothetical protein
MVEPILGKAYCTIPTEALRSQGGKFRSPRSAYIAFKEAYIMAPNQEAYIRTPN